MESFLPSGPTKLQYSVIALLVFQLANKTLENVGMLFIQLVLEAITSSID